MNDLGVIDRFLGVFSRYIDSGFGLLGGEVAFLTATLVVIDVTLAGLLWAMGGTDDVITKLLKKILYVGAFAFIITNFNTLASIIFRSFAGLGLTASGATITEAELLQPGRLATVGVDAGRPMLQQISLLTGFPDTFLNLDTITVLFIAWLVVLISFFILAVQLFVTLIEFKLTTLAGFVLVPFALWNKTAFLAERVLGNVISSGVKVLVLAVIVGIGTGLFSQFSAPPGTDPSLDQALATVLASLSLLGLGLFGPGIATGLVAGAPQLGAGAAAGTTLGAAGVAAAGVATVAAGARIAAGAGGAAARAASSLGSGARMATGPTAIPSGARGAPAAAALSSSSRGVGTAVGSSSSAGPFTIGGRDDSQTHAPSWARRLNRQTLLHGAAVAAHVVRSSDRGGSGASPRLRDDPER